MGDGKGATFKQSKTESKPMKDSQVPVFINVSDLENKHVNITFIRSFELKNDYLEISVPYINGEWTYHIPPPKAQIIYAKLKGFSVG